MKIDKIKRENNTVIYTSSTTEYYKWIKHNPIKFIERYCVIKLKWYQKIMLLFTHHKTKRKQNEVEKVIRKYMGY